MISLELTAAPKPATPTLPWNTVSTNALPTNTVPIKDLHRLIADIRRSRACFSLTAENRAEPISLESVVGCDPRD